MLSACLQLLTLHPNSLPVLSYVLASAGHAVHRLHPRFIFSRAESSHSIPNWQIPERARPFWFHRDHKVGILSSMTSAAASLCTIDPRPNDWSFHTATQRWSSSIVGTPRTRSPLSPFALTGGCRTSSFHSCWTRGATPNGALEIMPNMSLAQAKAQTNNCVPSSWDRMTDDEHPTHSASAV
ncbi:hypothetical protein BC628DRAFT_415940 [Trametes gibbosa]|nr:hypothetical protein BC628DRAFT_415940 [Trametes gibbosa]